MAPQPVLLLLLWGLVSVPGAAAASWCNVSCSTDYVSLVNCSCSKAPPPPGRVLVQVACSDDDNNITVSGSCHISPAHSWCSVSLTLDDVASVGTQCTTEVSREGGDANETSSWELADSVKPPAPHDVGVASAAQSYHITWSAVGLSSADCLTFRVRIRGRSGEPQEPDRTFLVGGRSLQLDRQTLRLRPAADYAADVQSKMCPENVYQGPWSEWSPAAAWRTDAARAGADGISGAWWLASLPLVLVLGLVLLGYLHRPCWQQKLRLIQLIPKPDPFFKDPDGNYREWVKPAFGEYDYFRVDPAGERQQDQDVLRWSDGGPRRGPAFLHLLAAELPEAAGRSAGRVSILTVTLSGDDGEDGGYRDGDSIGSLDEDAGGPGAAAAAAASGQSGGGGGGGRPPEEPRPRAMEPERASLDSFVSNGPSEDGYPRVDLDTIDSGFGECGSPVASPAGPPPHADPFLQPASNYVKQWMSGGDADAAQEPS